MAYDEFLPIDRRRARLKQYRLIAMIAAVCIVLGGLVTWLIYEHIQTSKDPFTSSIKASVNFPLYYPKTLPAGYHIVKNSVSKPQKYVVTFGLSKSSGQPSLYVSEEAQPNSFNFSNYYSSLKKNITTTTTNGQVVVGYSYGAEIGSFVLNGVWIFSNTRDQIPEYQLEAMLGSMIAAK